jgi:hypothetical protein
MERISSHRATYRWTPEERDAGKYEFAALVSTQIPTPLLEIEPNSIERLEVSCFSAPQGRASPAAAQCSKTWHGTASGLISDTIEFTATLTWEADEARNNDPGRVPTQVFYKPKGSAKIEFLVYKQAGCIVSPELFSEFDLPSMLMIDGSTSPPSYRFMVQVVSGLTISCPGAQPIVLPPGGVLMFSGDGRLNEQGTIEGSHVTPQSTYTWSFSPGAFPQGGGFARR